MNKMATRKLKRDTKSLSSDISMTMTDMFDEFMLVKKGEGLAKRTVDEYYKNYEYLKDYIGREISTDEMTTELFMGWIEYMLEEMEYSLAKVNNRVRTNRAFLRYCYEEKPWISKPIHRRFKLVKVPIDNVEALTTEEFRRLIGGIDETSYTGFRTKVQTFVLLDAM